MDSRKDKSAASGGFRTDVEGLRAVAIVAVLLCHAGIPAFAGGYIGVDVFFVISGFLITRLLLGELKRHRTISIPRFYARRAKRLLPLSALLLGAVGVLSLLLLSPLRAVEVSGDIISSATYTANWHFAAQSVDYFAQDLEPSPVLHLWSLAIEEQFYLVWPALMLGATWYQRRKGRQVRGILMLTLLLVFAGSLAFGIAYTNSEPAAAYFSTFGRAWELALGGCLALLGAVRLHRAAAVALGWAGVAAIVYAALVFDSNTPFPGIAALVPTMGAAALILAGSTVRPPAKAAPATPLSLRPVRYVGRISYSWYLWHWPALIFAVVILGHHLTPLEGVAVVLISLLPTVLSHHFVEDPVRRARSLARIPGRALALGAACMVFAIGIGIALDDAQPTLHTAPISEVEGAAALASQPLPQQRAAALRPNPLDARADRSQAFYDGCLVGISGTNSGHCLYGNPQGTRTLILFGDSHALQYFAPLEKLATHNDWRLIVLTKAECSPGEVEIQSMVADREYSQCDSWREKELQRIEEAGSRATLVMSGDTAYTAYGPNGEKLSGKANADALEAGYKATLTRLNRAGLDTVVIRDTPASVNDVPSCVSEDLEDLEACAFERPHNWDIEFDVRAAKATPGTHLIDVTAEICPSELCRAVIGNALVYRDKTHLTATFARTLSPWLEEGIRESF
jgi:peptidoglycan/LPS O-acetylase OafA/YrhL